MSGDLDLDGHRILHLPEPVAPSEPARKSDTDAIDAAKLDRSGGTITGPLSMSGTIEDGTVAGGLLELESGLLVTQSYTQTTSPTDPAIGSGIRYVWNAIFADSGVVGPMAQTSLYGPRAAVNLEGDLRYAAPTSPLTLLPLSFTSMLKVGNVHGREMTLTPSWCFLDAQIFVAHSAKVTAVRNDFSYGGYAFVNARTFVTADGGEWDGEAADTEIGGYIDGPIATGNVHFARRVGARFKDFNAYSPTLGDATTMARILAVVDGLGLDDIDLGVLGTVNDNWCIVIERQTAGRHSNVGLHNSSTTVEPAWVSAVDDAAAVIDTTASTIELVNRSGAAITLTSTPTMLRALDGQRITLLNASDDAVVLQDEARLPGSGLRLASPIRQLGQGDGLMLVYSDTLGAWVEIGGNDPSLSPSPDPASDNDADQAGSILASTRSVTSTRLLDAGGVFIHAGEASTWTLPPIESSAHQWVRIKHGGSGPLTLNAASEDALYSDAAYNSIVLAPGEAIELVNDGVVWQVLARHRTA